MKVRKARLCDAGEIHALMQPHVQQGLLLPRSVSYLCENIRDFTLIQDAQGRIAACGALHFFDEDLAELQSLAVLPACQGRGLGQKMVAALLREARRHRVWKVFSLTHAPEFFLRQGFAPTDIKQLPRKFMRDCIACPKLRHCHQSAVICDIYAARPARAGETMSVEHPRTEMRLVGAGA